MKLWPRNRAALPDPQFTSLSMIYIITIHNSYLESNHLAKLHLILGSWGYSSINLGGNTAESFLAGVLKLFGSKTFPAYGSREQSKCDLGVS